MANTTVDFARRTCFSAGVVGHVVWTIGPGGLASDNAETIVYSPTPEYLSSASCRVDDVTQVDDWQLKCRTLFHRFCISHLISKPVEVASRLTLCSEASESYNINGYWYRTMLRFEIGTQLVWRPTTATPLLCRSQRTCRLNFYRSRRTARCGRRGAVGRCRERVRRGVRACLRPCPSPMAGAWPAVVTCGRCDVPRGQTVETPP